MFVNVSALEIGDFSTESKVTWMGSSLMWQRLLAKTITADGLHYLAARAFKL